MNETIAPRPTKGHAVIKLRGDLIITYPTGVLIMAKIVYTATTLAAELDTDPRTARKFFRSPDSGIAPVGKGARYSLEFTAPQLGTLKKKFTAWSAAAAAKKVEGESQAVEAPELPATVKVTRKRRATGTKSSPATKITVETDDDVSVEDLTDEEFTAMIAEIEAEGEDEA